MSATDIAIIGVSFKVPGASDLDRFWSNVIQAKTCISYLAPPGDKPDQPRVVNARGLLTDIDQFDAAFFGIPPREASLMDPQHRLFLECAWAALEDSGYGAGDYSGAISVYAASGPNTYLAASGAQFESPAEKFQSYITNDCDFLPTRIAYELNLHGESIAVQTACSSSLVAVHLACQSLLSGNSDMALAGGVNITIPQEVGYTYQEGMIYSPDGYCRPFDEKAEGMVEGNGLGIVVLKRLDEAIADGDHIYAVIKGSAINNDGNAKVGYTAPSVNGQAEVIATALSVAGAPADSIGYIEAHGTGTKLGDLIEVSALTKAFRLQSDRRQFCALGSVKAGIGHLIHAAGIAGLIKAALVVENGIIPPIVNFQTPNREIDFEASPFFVAKEPMEWPSALVPRRVGVSSFGVGGTNAHVVLEQAPRRERTIPSGPFVITLSARSEAALAARKADLARYLQSKTDVNLPDVAFTLSVGRKAFPIRWAAVAETREELLWLLQGAPAAESGSAGSGAPDDVAGNTREVLQDLACRWQAGETIDWAPVYASQQCVRLPLPTYPFERRRYWMEKTVQTTQINTGANSPLEKIGDIRRWFYVPTWQRTRLPIPFKSGDLATRSGTWVLFLENGEYLGTETAQKMQLEGVSIAQVFRGDVFRVSGSNTYQINPDKDTDYALLAQQLQTDCGPVAGVLYFWDCKPNDVIIDGTEKNSTFYDLLRLFRAMTAGKLICPVWVVTGNGQCAPDSLRQVDLQKALSFGLCQVVSQEHAGIPCRCIDFEYSAENAVAREQQVNQLLSEIAEQGSDREVTYRGPYRWITAFQPATAEDEAAVPVRHGGVYLITGGLGRIGLSLAEFLARKYQVKLVLTSREGLPPESQWDEHLSSANDSNATKRRIQAVQHLKSLNADVWVAKADVADPDQMRRLVQDIYHRHGVLHGVLHAAGVVENSQLRFISEMTDETAAAVLRPKLQGTAVLADVLSTYDIDFCLVFSSLSAVLGGITYGAYTAANRFQDAFTRYQHEVRHKPWKSVNWDTWVFPEQEVEFGAGLSGPGILPAEGIEAFVTSFTLPHSQLIVCPVDLAQKKDRTLQLFQSLQSAEVGGSADQASAKAQSDVCQEVGEALLEIIRDIVGSQEVSPEDDLFDIGIDSLSLAQVAAVIRERLGIQISLAQCFNASTTAELAEICKAAREKAAAAAAREQGAETLVYDIPVGDEIATITTTKADYLKYGLPEGARNLRPLSDSNSKE